MNEKKLTKIISSMKLGIISIFSVALLASSFIIDYTDLPKGFELAKVGFLKYASFTIIALGIILWILNSLREKRIVVSRTFALLNVILFVTLLSTLFSPFQNTAFWGNSFREQGFFLHLVIFIAIYIFYEVFEKKFWHFITLPIIFSGLLQAMIGITEYIDLSNRMPSRIQEGMWINGNYGQANFFSGHLVLALILAFYYLRRSLARNKMNNIMISLTSIISILLLAAVIVISYSMWGIVTVIVAIPILILFELLPARIFYLLFLFITILGGVIGGYIIRTNTEPNFRLDIWKNLGEIMPKANIQNFLFGYGFDTLGELFKSLGYFKGSLVDRGHNIFIDIIAQLGVVGVTIFSTMFITVLNKLRAIFKDRKEAFFFFATFFLLFKMFIHEYSIVNLFQFLIIFVGLLRIIK